MKRSLLIIVLVVIVTATAAGIAVAVISQGIMLAKLGMPSSWSNSTLASYFGNGSVQGVAQDASVTDPGVSSQALQSRIHCEEQDNAVSSDASNSY